MQGQWLDQRRAMNTKPHWPAWSLLGGATYTPAHETNIAERFRKERQKLERERRDRERRQAHEQ